MLCFYFPPSNKPRRTFACLIARATLRHVARLEPHAGFVGGERVTFLLCTIRKHQPARRTTMDLSCAPGPLCWSSWHDAAVCHRCPNIHRFKRTRAVCVRHSKTAFFFDCIQSYFRLCMSPVCVSSAYNPVRWHDAKLHLTWAFLTFTSARAAFSSPFQHVAPINSTHGCVPFFPFLNNGFAHTHDRRIRPAT